MINWTIKRTNKQKTQAVTWCYYTSSIFFFAGGFWSTKIDQISLSIENQFRHEEYFTSETYWTLHIERKKFVDGKNVLMMCRL